MIASVHLAAPGPVALGLEVAVAPALGTTFAGPVPVVCAAGLVGRVVVAALEVTGVPVLATAAGAVLLAGGAAAVLFGWALGTGRGATLAPLPSSSWITAYADAAEVATGRPNFSVVWISMLDMVRVGRGLGLLTCEVGVLAGLNLGKDGSDVDRSCGGHNC